MVVAQPVPIPTAAGMPPVTCISCIMVIVMCCMLSGCCIEEGFADGRNVEVSGTAYADPV